MNKEHDINQIQEYYDDFLASEPGKHSPLAEFEARYNPILSYLQTVSRKGQRILDIGCGTGMATEKLTEFGDVYGVDLSPKSIKDLKDNNRCLDAVVSMGETPPFGSATFDIIVCTELIEHLIDPNTAIHNMNRILKPGGHLLLSTPNPRYYPGIKGIAGRILTRLKGKKVSSGQIIENLISYRKLESLLRQNGLTINRHYTVYFHSDIIMRILRLFTPNIGLYQICFARKNSK